MIALTAARNSSYEDWCSKSFGGVIITQLVGRLVCAAAPKAALEVT